jgi:hypothetical protein
VNQWIVGVGSSLIASAITAVLVTFSPVALWQRYWPVAVALGVGVVWFSGWWFWTRWTVLERRLDEIEMSAGDSNVERVAHRVLAGTNSRLLDVEQKVTRLEGVAPKSQIRACTYCGLKIDDAREEWGQIPGSQVDSDVAHARCIANVWSRDR